MGNSIRVLELLKSSDDYVSGEYISRLLSVSRTSVWKYIKWLRDQGYIIDAKERKGYRLLEVPDRLYPWEIMGKLRGCTLVKDVVYYQEVGSTQEVALRLAEEGKHSILVVAERQIRGRGRASKTWVSPDGGIWFSLIMPSMRLESITLLSLVTALAVCNAINSNYNLNAMIKWPNDVVIEYRKVAGILIDASIEQDEIHYAVVGVGVNANISKSKIESSIYSLGIGKREYGYYGVTTLMDELNRCIDRLNLLGSIVLELEKLYSLMNKDRVQLVNDICKRVILGRVSVIGRERIEGHAIGIDEQDGSLLVDDGNSVRRVVYGDVHVRFKE
jgi:BirA family biotin operon repressor/biotin-[acetyl-CoA-carboxylase] ligase